MPRNSYTPLFLFVLALIGFLVGAVSPIHAQPPPPPPPPPPPIPPLGAPVAPPGNPVTVAKANLGKALFWDEQLSSTRTVSCGTCHQFTEGGSDPRSVIGSARSLNPGPDGIAGNADDIVASPGVIASGADSLYRWNDTFGLREQVTGRKAPTTINAAFAPLLFWDGRATATFTDPTTNQVVLLANAALESQAAGPPVSDAEMAHTGRDWNDVAGRVANAKPLELSPSIPAALSTWIAGRTYPELFEEAFGSEAVTPSRIIMAIATYERTLVSNQAPFDGFIAGTANSLTQQELAGFNVFNAKQCNVCHGGNRLTDDRFHYIGVRPQADDLGRFGITNDLGDRGSFKTPSLRNVELRGPYMHNGRFATLEDVVDFYNRGGDFNAPNKAVQIVPLNLTAQERADLLAFLRRPLSDPRVAAGTSPFDPPALYAASSRVPVTGTSAGRAGLGGIVPQAIALEPPLAGNPNMTLGLTGGRGGAQAVLVIDSAVPPAGGPIPATGSFARVAVTLGGTGAGAGYGSASLAVSTNPSVVGRTFHGRWYVTDAAAAGGVAASPSFSFTVFGTAVTPTVGFNGLAFY